MDRRRFLGVALTACGTLALPRLASAKEHHKIVSIERHPEGRTFRLALAHAPFPCAGAPYADPSVFVFVPRHYRAPDSRDLDAVVHFHGHNTTAERALVAHALREQLFDSKQNAILVVPQGAVMAPESGIGKLARPGGLRRLLAEVARVLDGAEARDALGASAAPREARLGTLCLSAHSGGYTSVASSIAHGGVPVREVFLFDALYGDTPVYRDWVLGTPRDRDRRKLVSYYAGERVRSNNLTLMAALEARGVECLHETAGRRLTRAELTRGRAVFIASGAGHAGVTYETNALRDCLYASCLRRRVDSDWFDDAGEPRRLDRRASAGSGSAQR